MVCVRNALYDGLPFQLCKDDTDIQHRPPHRCGGVELFRTGYELHVVLREQLHHLGKVQYRAAYTVELVHHHAGNQPGFDVRYKLLELRPVGIFLPEKPLS